jgi:hypothetical protein
VVWVPQRPKLGSEGGVSGILIGYLGDLMVEIVGLTSISMVLTGRGGGLAMGAKE